MAYLCRDCGYKGTKRSELGGCPACGSGNFGRQGAVLEAEAPKGSSPMRLAFMAALWAWLIFEIHRKLTGA